MAVSPRFCFTGPRGLSSPPCRPPDSPKALGLGLAGLKSLPSQLKVDLETTSLVLSMNSQKR